ncbi:MAG: hypothetical protein FWE20_12955 [Defluviitaleaceae bacterium]|nr:hypothetical protein [Defluviitaleaceae bacterium]
MCQWHTFSILSASVGGGSDARGSPQSPILALWGGLSVPVVVRKEFTTTKGGKPGPPRSPGLASWGGV